MFLDPLPMMYSFRTLFVLQRCSHVDDFNNRNTILTLLCLCARLLICALWSPAGKGLTSWLSFVVSNCEFVTFPFCILGQVWYLIVSNLYLCTRIYFLSYLNKVIDTINSIKLFLNFITDTQN